MHPFERPVGAGVRLTVKERMLLHLADFVTFAERPEVPPEVSQEGIARSAGIQVQHVRQFVDPLLREGLLKERTAHVTGHRRRLKVYDLTDSGRLVAARLRDQVRREAIRVRDAGGIRHTTVGDLLRETEGRIPLLELLRQAVDGNVVDLAIPTGPVATFVERLSDAPSVGSFVGRAAELASLADPEAIERIVVVLGVAGIGKSTLAAKACEVLRGTRNLLWHRVRPWDSEIALLGSIAEFLAALGRPGLRAVLARGEVFRARDVLRVDLPGTKAFLVFDDVHEAKEAAERFLRILKEAVSDAPDVRIVVLSRERVPFYDRRDATIDKRVREISLSGLSEDEMWSLLPSSDAEAGRLLKRVGGHPLFAALVRANPARPGQALRDFRRFLAEEVYTRLSGPQRRVMKVASVYRVPVPKEALFLDPSASYDSIVELTELALLRPIGEAEYDVHDSIREFFEELLSESERREIGGFAAQRLEAVAESARDRGDRMASIQALSNAVRLSGERPEHPRLLEELGDALESIGDLPDALAAYRESLGRSTSVEDRARLHRKAASAFEERADIPSARAEIDAGLEALGDAVIPERGWLLAIRCAVTRYADEYEEAREYGREALRVFRECRDPRGEVRALLELGWTDLVSPTGDSEAAEPLLTEAFTKGESVGDSQLLGNVRIALSQMYGYSGRPDEGLKHLAALEDVPILHIRRSALEMKGWLLVNFRGDFDGAEAAFRESGDLARQMFDPVTMTIAKYGLAIVRYYQGQMKEAQAAFREVAREFRSEGIPGFIDEVQDLAARTALIEGNVETFRRDAAALAGHDSSHGAEVRSSIVLTTRGLICLLDGDETGCDAAFAAALTEAKMPHLLNAHLLYGAALRAMGRHSEAERQLSEARELAKRFGRTPYLNTMDDISDRIAATLRKGIPMKDAHGTRKDGPGRRPKSRR